jgi:hypothetical protein
VVFDLQVSEEEKEKKKGGRIIFSPFKNPAH